MSNNAHELSNRLLNALDNNYNVVDMQAVNEIISILEKFNITKELLETTRLGKHVNELRRKTTDPTLARRAKVLVKRWRDLVIPAVASPAHTGSNRSSAERQVRRLGGTPLTSPALSRQVVSPAVPSPRHLARPAWGGYESDSQDVILVDDDPPAPLVPFNPLAPLPPLPGGPLAPLVAHKPLTPPVKRPPSPESLQDDKRAKRDKKPKKRRGHSRAGSGTETTAPSSPTAHAPMLTPTPTPTPTATLTVPLGHAWGARNGSGGERRRNGMRREAKDPYAALVNRLPPAGAKKVKTTKELLEQIQSRGAKPLSRAGSPASPASPASPDVMLIEPDGEAYPVKAESPLRNGVEVKVEEPEKMEPLEEEREWVECTCVMPEPAADGEGAGPAAEGVEPALMGSETCPAARGRGVRPMHVRALHHALVPGVNGTRAPPLPHRFAVRPAEDPARPGLFTSVVPLYNYSDYAHDRCVKNLARVPICTHLPWTQFAPPPPSPPPPPDPPELRPYPWPDTPEIPKFDPELDVSMDSADLPDTKDVDIKEETKVEKLEYESKVEPEMVGVPSLEPSERLKAPLLSNEEETQFEAEQKIKMEVEKQFASEPQEHRTVERTKEEMDGRKLYSLCESTIRSIPWTYDQAATAPVVNASLLEEPDSEERLERALQEAHESTERDELGRPEPAPRFAEWHECARLGDLVALPYVVLD